MSSDRVDLPLPEGPMTPSSSPRRAVKLMPSSASVSSSVPYEYVTLENSMVSMSVSSSLPKAVRLVR